MRHHRDPRAGQHPDRPVSAPADRGSRLEEQDRSRFLAVPRGFREEVEQAAASKRAGDLGLLAAEAEGFEWESEGLRIVGRAQFGLEASPGARATWEKIRRLDEEDLETNTLLATIDQRLGDLTRSDHAIQPCGEQAETRPRTFRILLFTGHMIDAPGRASPRFPADREDVARQAIRRAVESELKRPGGVAGGIAGGASGGDILFHEICAELRIPTQVFLALPRGQFIEESVRPAGGNWRERFDSLLDKLPSRVLAESQELPGWLAKKPDYGIWQRNNLWMLYNALAQGGEDVTLIALWDRKKGDGPGGTVDLVERAKERHAETVILDTRDLFGNPEAAGDPD